MFQVHALPIRHNHRGHEGLAKQQLYQVRRPSLTRLTLMALVVGVLLAAPAVSSSQPVLLTPPQLDQLVTRIAPYPDPLLAQVLTASTYSNQIAEAATWADQHSYLKGDALARAIQDDQLPWDASVLALLPFPSVLDMMAHDPAWTEQLGNAVLTQRSEVMDAVQRMRRKARDYGYLGPNGYVNVLTDGGYIQILPANPGAIYVPYYDPYVVFAPPRPGFVVATAIHFGPAVMIGAAFDTWGWWFGSGFLWPSHAILIDHRPWERVWVGRDVYVHPYAHPWVHPVGPRVEVHHLATACADSAVSPLCLEYNKLRRIRLLRTFSAVKEALMREEPFKADESA